MKTFDKFKIAAYTIVCSAIAVAGFVTLLSAAQPAAAAPAFPGGSSRVSANPRVVTLFSDVLTQSAQGSSFVLPEFDRLDVQYVLEYSGTNTVTLKLLHSNNSTTWVAGATFANAVTTAGSDMTSTFNFGNWTAVSVTLAGSNPVTVSVLALVK